MLLKEDAEYLNKRVDHLETQVNFLQSLIQGQRACCSSCHAGGPGGGGLGNSTSPYHRERISGGGI